MPLNRDNRTTRDYEPRLDVEGRGPLLLYVPGIDGTGKLFYRQAPSLAHAGFAVASYRLRDEADHMSTLVQDLDHVLGSALERTSLPKESPVILVGESFGGALALSYALARPLSVRRLVIVNSFPFFRPQFRLRLGIRALELLNWKTMAIVRRLTAPFLHSRHTGRAEMRRFLTLTDETTVAGYANRLRALTQYDVRNALPALRVPTLFLASDRDHLVPSVRQARLMDALAPRSKLRILEGHGHICLIAPGVDLAEIILDWAPDALARG